MCAFPHYIRCGKILSTTPLRWPVLSIASLKIWPNWKIKNLKKKRRAIKSKRVTNITRRRASALAVNAIPAAAVVAVVVAAKREAAMRGGDEPAVAEVGLPSVIEIVVATSSREVVRRRIGLDAAIEAETAATETSLLVVILTGEDVTMMTSAPEESRMA